MALRVLRLAGPRACVYPADDALDVPERSQFQQDPHGVGDKEFAAAVDVYEAKWKHFEETRDPSVLPVKAGQRPTVFQVASLTESQIARTNSVPLGEMMNETIAYGVRHFDGLIVETEAGSVEVKCETKGTPLGRRLTAESLAPLLSSDTLRTFLFVQVKEAGMLNPETRKSHRS